MDFSAFYNILSSKGNTINIEINEETANKFYNYMKLLLDWNNKINLTAITEPNDIVLKHFIDSLTIEKYINKGANIIDVGTGAGFPGLPLSIIRDDVNITLLDSLNKRIKFLDEVINKLELGNINAVHGRAEELGNNANYREKFDVATSRAVAPLNVLLEYMLPFVKIGGYCICMKGANIEDELNSSKKALDILKGRVEKIDSFKLPGSDFDRNVIVIKKIGNVSSRFPRKAGTPSKEPLC